MLAVITGLFALVNLIYLCLFFTNSEDVMVKWFRDFKDPVGPVALVACGGFAVFPLLNIFVTIFLVYKYNYLSKKED